MPTKGSLYEWIKEHGVRYFTWTHGIWRNLLEEVGEVARIINCSQVCVNKVKRSDKLKDSRAKNWQMLYLWYCVWQTKHE